MIVVIKKGEGEYDAYHEFVTGVYSVDTEHNGEVLEAMWRQAREDKVTSHPDYVENDNKVRIRIAKEVKLIDYTFLAWLKEKFEVKPLSPFFEIVDF